MLHRPSVVFDQLKAAVFKLPVIDCHEHMGGPQFAESFREPIAALIFGYLGYDLVSAGAEPATWRLLLDQDVPTEKKWPIFEPLWQRVQHTAYARVTRLIMQRVYGVAEMSVTSLRCIGEQLAGRDEAYYWQVIEQANIRALVTDFLWFEPGDFGAYVAGEQTFPDRIRQTIPLPLFHVVQSVDTSLRKWEGTSSARDWPGVQVIAGWANRHITSLDEFLQAVFEVFCRAKARGAVGFKDVSAYMRSLHYDLPTRGEAERIFNRLLVDPRVVFGWPEARPLDDFLFHQYMRFARELDLPVQVHTGQLGGVYNRLDKANAALFGSVLELHRRVRFELLHANLPYMGDMLFLAKNYPNVVLNLTWVHIIDPLYAEGILKRALVTVPHSKVHGFGGDYGDAPEYSAAHLEIAREVIASALCEMVECGWLGEQEALNVAADWLYNNPNTFWKLGLQPISGSEYL